uniref:TAZ-type domain-containing protein n=1 Tax=Heterorhabditis bacteriophora TaxID=37862 RepID=A0A1I7WNR4_HETBA
MNKPTDGKCPELENCAETCIAEEVILKFRDPFSCVFRRRCSRHCLDEWRCAPCHNVVKRVFTGFCHRRGLTEKFVYRKAQFMLKFDPTSHHYKMYILLISLLVHLFTLNDNKFYFIFIDIYEISCLANLFEGKYAKWVIISTEITTYFFCK